MTETRHSDRRVLQCIAPRNILSFGPNATSLDLLGLNVLIGSNGSGKSNLLDVISLMRATPADLRAVVRRGGGPGEWVWKGGKGEPASAEIAVGNPAGEQPLRHYLSFRGVEAAFRLEEEFIESEASPPEGTEDFFRYVYHPGQSVSISARRAGLVEKRELALERFKADHSILAQYRAPDLFPEIAYLAEFYEGVRIYREWAFGRNTVFREPQKADMRNDRLEEDFSNLGLVLNRMRSKHPAAKQAILDGLKDLYDGVTDFEVFVEGGSVQVFVHEGDFIVPATRLSDGTLRYLCLLTILCDPQPGPLICIEEPELGLHPDILPKIADLLVAASERTQLIVTTHSDILVDAMTERPEAVVVCEKHEGQTQMHRLDRDKLAEWLERYRLGELWIKGGIGGTRW